MSIWEGLKRVAFVVFSDNTTGPEFYSPVIRLLLHWLELVGLMKAKE